MGSDLRGSAQNLVAYLLVTVALFMLYLGQNRAFCEQKYLIGCLRAQTTRTKTPVLAITFGVPMTSVSPYLNHVRYEDDQTAIYHSNSAQIHFPVSKLFLLLSSPPTAMLMS